MSIRRWLAAPPAAEGFTSRLSLVLGFLCAMVAGMALMAIIVSVLYRSGVLFPCHGRDICSR
jgi:hypothetical protein